MQFKKHCIENGSWSRDVETPKPEQPFKKWEFEGDEQSLIEMTERQEREKQDLQPEVPITGD